MSEALREKCGVAAGLLVEPGQKVAPFIKESLLAMQNRGREAAGMVTENGGHALHVKKGAGLVKHVLDELAMEELIGDIGVGHIRYSTSGSKSGNHLPYDEKQIGMAYALNGNIPDTSEMEVQLRRHHIKPERTNDAGMIGMLIGQNIRDGRDLPDAVEAAYPLFTGAHSSVAMHDGTVVAWRDPCGMRPLTYGYNELGYFVASETNGLDKVRPDFSADVKPGEMVIITKGGVETRSLAEPDPALDIFEFVYFARQTSTLNGVRVKTFRNALGRQLASEHPPAYGESKNILVVPIPETSRPIAIAYANALGLTYDEAVDKNPDAGRTFILPEVLRKPELDRKLTVIPEDVRGKHVVAIDDSMVRGNTAPPLTHAMQAAGALSVTLLLASPPIRFPDYYGIDTPDQKELIAAQMEIDDMRKHISANYLGFLSLRGLRTVVQNLGMNPDHFNYSCFDGNYRIPIGNRINEVQAPVSMEFAE
jgi:amidophosphoribosyltransferase